MNKKYVVCLILILIFASGCTKAEKQEIAPVMPVVEKSQCAFDDLSVEEQEHACNQYCENSLDFVKMDSYPIDIEERKCIKNAGGSNIAMGNCVYTAMDAWYKEIEKNLKILKEIMTPEQYKRLEASQKNWENYVKSEFELDDNVIFYKTGTVYYPINAASKHTVVKDRAIVLESYISYMKEP